MAFKTQFKNTRTYSSGQNKSSVRSVGSKLKNIKYKNASNIVWEYLAASGHTYIQTNIVCMYAECIFCNMPQYAQDFKSKL